MATCATAAAVAAATGCGIGRAVTRKAMSSAGRALVACNCHKMFVPGFGGRTPEARAADTLHNFFTYIAVKIVASQLEDYNKEAYDDLMKFLDKVPLKDGDKFCSALMRESGRHKGLALRILEVRAAYASGDFEWENVKKLSLQKMDSSNTRLMRDFLAETTGIE